MQKPKTLYELFQQKQPIAITGTMRHLVIWALNPITQKVYPNPGFKDSGRKVVIYCIHGTGDQPSAFSLVASKLLGMLSSNVSEIRLVSFAERGQGRDIETFARQLKDQIITNQDDDVILIGHSRGGLVAAYFTEKLAQANNVKVHGVMAVCTPFSGADTACAPFTWVSDSIEEMRPNSAFLQDLTQSMEQSTVPYHYFSAGRDTVVSSKNCVINASRDELVELDRHSHLSVLSSNRLVEHLANCINIDLSAASALTNSTAPYKNG